MVFNSSQLAVNKVTLVGRVGNDPQLKGSEQVPVVVFSLATNLRYRDNGSDELVQKTDWHRISVFQESLRRVCMEYVRKG